MQAWLDHLPTSVASSPVDDGPATDDWRVLWRFVDAVLARQREAPPRLPYLALPRRDGSPAGWLIDVVVSNSKGDLPRVMPVRLDGGEGGLLHLTPGTTAGGGVVGRLYRVREATSAAVRHTDDPDDLFPHHQGWTTATSRVPIADLRQRQLFVVLVWVLWRVDDDWKGDPRRIMETVARYVTETAHRELVEAWGHRLAQLAHRWACTPDDERAIHTLWEAHRYLRVTPPVADIDTPTTTRVIDPGGRPRSIYAWGEGTSTTLVAA